MPIAMRTVSINPAFLREIKDDHHELRQLQHHTSAMLDRLGPEEIEHKRLVHMFSKLRDQLAMHFSLEEAYGYQEDAIDIAPHLCRRAERLQAQHFELFDEFCCLVEISLQLLYHEQPRTLLSALAGGYRRFQVRFREHESQERELILEALNEDIGTVD
jgi:hypothetical protein